MASTTVPSQAHMIAPEIPTSDVTESKIPLPAVDGPSSDTLVEKDPEKQTTPDSTGSTLGAEEAEDVQQYPPARRVILIMLSLYLVMFLVALDRTIIATAIPYMTNEFNSFGDVGWYGSSYMLTVSGFMLLLGRVYTFYSPKWVFLTCIAIFELGSAVCGAAPTSTAFILGRAVAGVGAAGIMNGGIMIMVNIIPLAKRPMYQAMFGSVFGIASVVGPVLGGVFTQDVSWRWCFYINLPIGAVSMAVVAFVLKVPSNRTHKTLKEQITQLDPIGTAFLMPGIICLLLAMQWGGSTYAWNNGRIIALLVIFGSCLCAFTAVQAWKGDMATVPPHIIKQRSIAAAFWLAFCMGGTMMIVIYYLPIWFQAIKYATPVHSGIMILPSLLALVVSSFLAGVFTKKTGYYAPMMIASSVVMPIGVGLFTTFTPETGHAKWIGYQILFGFGLGLGMQQGSMAAQTVLAKKDVPTGVSLNFFAQQLGGSIFVSVGENILVNRLLAGLSSIPDFDPAVIVNTGATEIKSAVGSQYLDVVRIIYNHAITDVFDVAVALACLTVIGSLLIEWRSVKAQKDR